MAGTRGDVTALIDPSIHHRRLAGRLAFSRLLVRAARFAHLLPASAPVCWTPRSLNRRTSDNSTGPDQTRTAPHPRSLTIPNSHHPHLVRAVPLSRSACPAGVPPLPAAVLLMTLSSSQSPPRQSPRRGPSFLAQPAPCARAFPSVLHFRTLVWKGDPPAADLTSPFRSQLPREQSSSRQKARFLSRRALFDGSGSGAAHALALVTAPRSLAAPLAAPLSVSPQDLIFSSSHEIDWCPPHLVLGVHSVKNAVVRDCGPFGTTMRCAKRKA